jgi:hypothetical protein
MGISELVARFTHAGPAAKEPDLQSLKARLNINTLKRRAGIIGN